MKTLYCTLNLIHVQYNIYIHTDVIVYKIGKRKYHICTSEHERN